VAEFMTKDFSKRGRVLHRGVAGFEHNITPRGL
jgi:hypothetical protein